MTGHAIDYRHPNSVWDKDRVALIIKLQKDGLSAGGIAAELGITRSAAIGKLARLGLTGKYKRSLHATSRGWRALKDKLRPARAPRTPTTAGADGILSQRISRSVYNSAEKRAARDADAAELRERFACTEIVDLTPEQSATFCTIMQLNAHTCRWPIGTPASPDFGYCGAEPWGDRAYCGRHWEIGHVQPRRA
jgi:GcrA cell cycle regulator